MPPWKHVADAVGSRRRYLIAKKTIRPAISSEKKTEIASRKKYSASTRPAIVEACSGKRGVPVHIEAAQGCRAQRLRARALCGSRSRAHHDDDERAEREDGGGAGDPDRAHDHEAVAAGHRVVVVAEEQQRVDRRADLACRGLDEPSRRSRGRTRCRRGTATGGRPA